MFWERYCEECKKKNMTPSAVAAQFGLSRSMCTRWKQGSTPRIQLLTQLAEYFGVSAEYLAGYGDDVPSPTDDDYPGESTEPNKHWHLFATMATMTDAELNDLAKYADFIVSKR